MNSKPINILLIEDNEGDARFIQEMLSEINDFQFKFECAEKLSTGLVSLRKRKNEIVLLDLSLPDSQGFETFQEVHKSAPEIAVIVLTGLDDVTLGIKAVQAGAQDYLVKGKVDGSHLVRSIFYALERNRRMKELKTLSLTDSLTGLYNRRGFQTIGEETLRMAKRMERKVFLLYADINNMKSINDTHGHQKGDSALKSTAEILRETFRESDIIARIGGDEFVVLGFINSEPFAKTMNARLRQNVDTFNTENNHPFTLSISTGTVSYTTENHVSVEELLGKADQLMYKQKKAAK